MRAVPEVRSAPDSSPESAPDESSPTSPWEAQLEAISRERDEAMNRFLRASAELENYRKRVQRERDEERRYAALPIVRDFLPGLDNLRRALDAARSASDVKSLLQGVRMVLGQFDEILARYGAQPIEAAGQPFDPHRHEALQQVPSSDFPPMTVVEVVERGYQIHDRVIRPSKVIVAAPPAEPLTS